MLTIPMRFTSLSLLVVCLVVQVPVVWAQGASKAQRLEWPRTFTGQPDFAFTRDEALQEAINRATRQGQPLPKMYGMEDLVDDQTQLDPLGLVKPQASQQALVSGTDITSLTTTLAVIDPLMANVQALPMFTTSYTVDVTEFKASLAYALSSTVAGWKPSSAGYTFQGVAQSLVLQAIVTSPQRYAIINKQRYEEGDSFQLQVPVTVPDEQIIAALQARLPVSGTLTAEVQQQYQLAYEEVLGGYSVARSANPAIGQRMLMLPVIIKKIEPRKVTLDINGEQHDLQVKFAY